MSSTLALSALKFVLLASGAFGLRCFLFSYVISARTGSKRFRASYGFIRPGVERFVLCAVYGLGSWGVKLKLKLTQFGAIIL